jgi:hypothetical protein
MTHSAYFSSICPLHDFVERNKFFVSTTIGERTVGVRFALRDIGPGIFPMSALMDLNYDGETAKAAFGVLVAKIRLVLEHLQLIHHTCTTIISLVEENAHAMEFAGQSSILHDALLTIGMEPEFSEKWIRFVEAITVYLKTRAK